MSEKTSFYPNWKKNEVLRPATFGFYWIVMTVLMIYLIASFISPTVSAQNMTISNLDLVSKQAVLIYNSSGALLGTYNTSSNIISLPSSDFVVILKPNAISRFSNPTLFLQDLVGAVETYWIPTFMILGLFILPGVLAAKGRGR